MLKWASVTSEDGYGGHLQSLTAWIYKLGIFMCLSSLRGQFKLSLVESVGELQTLCP